MTKPRELIGIGPRVELESMLEGVVWPTSLLDNTGLAQQAIRGESKNIVTALAALARIWKQDGNTRWTLHSGDELGTMIGLGIRSEDALLVTFDADGPGAPVTAIGGEYGLAGILLQVGLPGIWVVGEEPPDKTAGLCLFLSTFVEGAPSLQILAVTLSTIAIEAHSFGFVTPPRGILASVQTDTRLRASWGIDEVPFDFGGLAERLTQMIGRFVGE
jgi:hypothetical protein